MEEVSNNFTGRTVLVTGGNSGIGRASALLFAKRGANVAIAARRQSELDATVAEIARTTGSEENLAAFRTDIADPDEVSVLINGVVSRFGSLDVAFNNAGVMGEWGPIEDLTPDNFDQAVSTNLRGTWLSVRAEIIQMKRQSAGGVIVNTSSWLGQGALTGSGIYSATKAALDGLVRPLALECAEHGIRINNVSPGVIDTEMLQRSTAEQSRQPFVTHTPLGRFGAAEDIAEAAVWLASSEASFVTGQSLLVDGGYAIPGNRGFAEVEPPQNQKREGAS